MSIKSLKKGFLALSLLVVSCGDNTKKWQAEIKEYKTTKVEPGVESLLARVNKCDSNDQEFVTIKKGFTKKGFKEGWIDPLTDLSNQDKLTNDDWDDFQRRKQNLTLFFHGFYTLLERIKC